MEIPFLVKSLSGRGQSYEIVGRWGTNRITCRMGPTIDFNLGFQFRLVPWSFLFWRFVYFVWSIRSNTNNITPYILGRHTGSSIPCYQYTKYSTASCTKSIVQVCILPEIKRTAAPARNPRLSARDLPGDGLQEGMHTLLYLWFWPGCIRKKEATILKKTTSRA